MDSQMITAEKQNFIFHLRAFAVLCKHRLIKPAIAFIFFYIIAMLSPLAADDYYFSSLQFDSFSEYMQYVLYFGNGRILGNSLVLLIVTHPLLLAAVKAMTFLLIGLFMSKIMNHMTGRQNETIVFFLLIAMPPQIFAQVFSWTSGFCNYAPPILCSLYLAYTFFASERKLGRIDEIIVFCVGGGSELFVEHSAIINFTLVCCIVGFCYIKKRNMVQAVTCWIGTFLGLLAVFLIPRIFVTTTGNEDYQKLNLGDLHEFLVSVVGNTMQICEEYSAAIALWVFLSIVMLARIRKHGNCRLIKIILLIFPIYSCIFYVITRCLAVETGVPVLAFHTFMMLAYLLSVCCVIYKTGKGKVRILSFGLVCLAIYSVIPLLVVYPIGERCLFHSYIVLLILAAINYTGEIGSLYADKAGSFKNRCDDIVSGIALLLAAVLIAIYCRIYYIDNVKTSYIEQCMEDHKTEIAIPEISSDYVHHSGNIMIEYAYFYDEPGDIVFTEMEYRDWLEAR